MNIFTLFQYPDTSTKEIDTAGIAKLSSEIDWYKAKGPDGIKELSHEVAPCLSLFDASLKQSTVPKDWKTALVAPIFRKSSHNDLCSYR